MFSECSTGNAGKTGLSWGLPEVGHFAFWMLENFIVGFDLNVEVEVNVAS